MPTFSTDGRIAAWISIPELWEPDYRSRLVSARLGEGGWHAKRTPIEGTARWHTLLALHPDGRQALISNFQAVAIVDLATARAEKSIAVPKAVAADFLPDGRVRLFHRTPDHAVLAVALWSPRDGAVTETLRIPGAVLLTRRGDVAVVAVGLREKAILDLASGTVHRIAGDDPDSLPQALVLADGRIALGMGREIRITDATGRTTARVPVPPKTQVSALREPEPGRLAVGVWSLVFSKRGTLFVDADTGAVSREEPGLLPAGAQSESRPQPAPGSVASRLFTDEEGALLALEPGARRRVLVAAAGSGE